MHSYIQTSLALIDAYDGRIPLHHFLRNYFRQHKKFGSRDRRWIKEICYAWFRTSFLLRNFRPEDHARYGLFLMNERHDPVLERILTAGGVVILLDEMEASLADKLLLLKARFPQLIDDGLFPFEELLSENLNKLDYSISFLRKPSVWIRVKVPFIEEVKAELIKAKIPFLNHRDIPGAFRVDPAAKLEDTFIFEKGWAEVQDLSSQKIAGWLDAKPHESWLDACAASGGKSLLLIDKEPQVRITVSDIRKTALENLKVRFKRNGVSAYAAVEMDFTSAGPHDFYKNRFDGIIADVPCSGSGTWSRTPEQLHFFTPEKLQHYCALQDAITAQLTSLLVPGGKMLYITCSVFKAENEDRVKALVEKQNMILQHMELIQGASEGADTLFCAYLLKK